MVAIFAPAPQPAAPAGSGLNRWSLGIELANAGRLMRHGDGWRAWFGDEYEDSEVIVATHEHEFLVHGWHIYPPEQAFASCVSLFPALC